MKRLFLLSLICFLSLTIWAQELDVQVTVNTPRLQTTDPKVFQDLEKAIKEFMTNQKWTNDEFQEEERIKVDIILTISEELSANSYRGELSLQSVRPVYKSSYETALLTHQDKDVVFSYEQFQPLEYSENTYNNNLTSVLAFYAYVIIGFDYDSFSPFGGEPYFQVAQEIVNNIPPTVANNFPGWRSTDSNRNRYWVIENLLTPRTREFRQATYDYHRQGLDLMSDDVATGRAIMAQAIDKVGGVNKNYPNAMIVQMFSNTKSDEIMDIFKMGSIQEKDKVIKVMQKVDASNANKYRALRR